MSMIVSLKFMYDCAGLLMYCAAYLGVRGSQVVGIREIDLLASVAQIPTSIGPFHLHKQTSPIFTFFAKC